MPQQYPLLHQPPQQQPYIAETYNSNDNNTSNTFPSPRQPIYNNYPQYPTYSATQPQIQSQPSNNSPINNKPDFQRFYGPVSLYLEKF